MLSTGHIEAAVRHIEAGVSDAEAVMGQKSSIGGPGLATMGLCALPTRPPML